MRLIITATIFLVFTAALDAAPKISPKAWMTGIAQRIERNEDRQRLERDALSPNLAALIRKAPDVYGRDFDADPLTGTQDTSIMRIVKIQEEANASVQGATEIVTYNPGGDRPLAIRYVLVPFSQSWRIDEIVYEDQHLGIRYFYTRTLQP